MQLAPITPLPKECPPVFCFFELEFKKKKCCKSYKDGKQCRKCPKLRALQA
jgi:hypothetical protein